MKPYNTVWTPITIEIYVKGNLQDSEAIAAQIAVIQQESYTAGYTEGLIHAYSLLNIDYR